MLLNLLLFLFRVHSVKLFLNIKNEIIIVGWSDTKEASEQRPITSPKNNYTEKKTKKN